MESFRNLIRGWLGKLLLILFLTPFALVGIEGYFSGGQQADAAKTVNGQVISKKDFDFQTKNLKDQYLKYVQGDETLLNVPFIENAALESLVARSLVVQQAKKLGIVLSDAQIEQMIAQAPDFHENGQFSKVLYEQYLRSVDMSSQALIENLRQDHALNMLSGAIASNALVNSVDITQIANLQTQKRDLYLSSIKLDAYRAAVKVSDQDIANYYDKHKDQFKQAAQVDVDYVVLSPSMLQQTQVSVTDAELQQAYAQFVEKRKQNFQHEVKQILIGVDTRTEAEAQKLANDVYAKIKAGQSFADAAAQYSDDPSSKAKGGLISYTAGAFGDEFDQAVNAGQGQVSQPVKTKFGYHLIVSKAISEAIPSFEAEKDKLAAELSKTKTANYFADTVNQLNDAVVNNDALDLVTQEIKTAKIETAKGVSLASKHAVLSDPNVKVKLFNDEVKNGDRNSSANIALANGDMVWVKVRDYHPAGIRTLDQVKNIVKTKVTEQKAYEAAKAKNAAIIADFKSMPAQQVLAKHGLAFEHAGTFTRSQGLKREIERAAFSLSAPKDGMWSVTTTALPNEMVMVAVANVSSAAEGALSPEQMNELTQLYQRQRGQQLLGDYTEYLKSKAKIK